MNKLIIVILFVIILLMGMTTTLLFSQGWDWEIQAKGLAYNWQVVDAVAPNVVAAYAEDAITGRGAILRSLDGGQTWQKFPWNGYAIHDLSIVDSLNFWIVSENFIYHTPDAGRTWELQYSGDSTTNFFNYIEMFDSFNGIAMGDGLPKQPILILRTTDGGKSWISQNQSRFINAFSAEIWRCIQFVTPEVGYGRFSYFGVNDSTQFLQKTVDGGKTWQSLPLNQRDFWTIRFYNENLGLAAWKGNQEIFRTLDGGDTWNSFATNLDNGWPADIEFFPDDPSKILIAFGSYFDCYSGLIQGNHLVFSSDTGKTWTELNITELNISDISKMFDVKMIDDQNGWIGGYDGIFHFSSKSTSSVMNEKATNFAFVLNQNYPNPFNSTTRISFHLKRPNIVSLRIYNLAGEEVASLLKNRAYSIGYHSIEFDANGLSNGIYFYRLITSQGFQTKRMIVLK